MVYGARALIVDCGWKKGVGRLGLGFSVLTSWQQKLDWIFFYKLEQNTFIGKDAAKKWAKGLTRRLVTLRIDVDGIDVL